MVCAALRRSIALATRRRHGATVNEGSALPAPCAVDRGEHDTAKHPAGVRRPRGRRHGPDVVHAPRPARRPRARGGEALRRGARPARAAGHGDGAGRAGAHVLRRLRPLASTRSTSRTSTSRSSPRSRSRATRSRRRRRSSAARSWSSAPAPAATRTPSASTRSSTTRASPARRASRATSASTPTTSARRSRTTSSASAPSALGADAILVSQVITQRNCHKENAAALVELVEAPGLARQGASCCSAARASITSSRVELGFDAGFGPGTKPLTVASFLVERLVGRA